MNDKYGDKYRVHNLVKFDYSEIGKYIDENHTDKPLRNDELVDLLNEQGNEIQRCKLAYAQLASYVDANFDEYMTQEKLNEQIKELESCNHGLAQKQKRKLTKIIELEKELNKKNEQIKELETRNKRQYYSLKKIFDLMYARDWKALESIVEDWEEFDKLLQEIHWCFEKENGDVDGS